MRPSAKSSSWVRLEEKEKDYAGRDETPSTIKGGGDVMSQRSSCNVKEVMKCHRGGNILSQVSGDVTLQNLPPQLEQTAW